MLTCQEVTEVITDYLEGRQSPLQRLRFQLHVGTCRHCRAYLRQMKRTIEALRGLSGKPIPPEMSREVLERLRTWKG